MTITAYLSNIGEQEHHLHSFSILSYSINCMHIDAILLSPWLPEETQPTHNQTHVYKNPAHFPPPATLKMYNSQPPMIQSSIYSLLHIFQPSS